VALDEALLQSIDAVGVASASALQVLGRSVGHVFPAVELTRWFALTDAQPEHPRPFAERFEATLRAVEAAGTSVSTLGNAVAVHRAPADEAVATMALALSILRDAARAHGLACVIDDAGATDRYTLLAAGGVNLLAPGTSPAEHLRFLFFAGAVIRALDEQPELDLGHDLTTIMRALARGETFAGSDEERATWGTPSLPPVKRRFAASPYTFTGAGFSLGRIDPFALIRINAKVATALAEQLRGLTGWLSAGEDLEPAVREVVAASYRRHLRVAAPVAQRVTGTRSVNTLP
jgi:glutamine synthetase type III